MPAMSPTVPEAVVATLKSGCHTQGPKVEEFEAKLRPYLGVQNILTLNSCTSALTLALHLIGVRGREVIVSPMTCIATITPIIQEGGIPVWADINPKTGLIDQEDVARKISKNTAAIIAIDWGGQPCDYIGLSVFNIPVISDSAHSFGTTSSLYADMVCYSHQAIKHLSCGDGGTLVVKDDEQYHRGRNLRWFGIDRDNGSSMRGLQDVEEAGFKFHMNDINATIGLENLNIIGTVLNHYAGIARRYNEELSDKYHCDNNFMLGGTHWLYTILVDNPTALQWELEENGIQSGKVHNRNDVHTAFRDYRCDLPGVDSFFNRMLCIPINAGLYEGQVTKVIEVMNSIA